MGIANTFLIMPAARGGKIIVSVPITNRNSKSVAIVYDLFYSEFTCTFDHVLPIDNFDLLGNALIFQRILFRPSTNAYAVYQSKQINPTLLLEIVLKTYRRTGAC